MWLFLLIGEPPWARSCPSIATLAVAALVVSALTLRIANQYERAVVFRFGRYNRTARARGCTPGPLIEWQRTVDLRIRTTAVEQQETITSDNVPIKVNAVIWYRIVDPERAVIEVQEHRQRRHPGGAHHTAQRASASIRSTRC